MIAKDYLEEQTLLDHPVNVNAAVEPTDIIWENRELTTHDKCHKWAHAIVIVLVMVALGFIVVLVLTKWKTEMHEKYPTVNCKNIDDLPVPN